MNFKIVNNHINLDQKSRHHQSQDAHSKQSLMSLIKKSTQQSDISLNQSEVLEDIYQTQSELQYHISCYTWINGQINLKALKKAHQITLSRAIPLYSVESVTIDDHFISSEQQAIELTDTFRVDPFDHKEGPLCRVKILHSPKHCVILHCYHHLLVDGMSFVKLWGSITQNYHQLNEPNEISNFVFPKYVQTKPTLAHQKNREFWDDYLKDLPVSTFKQKNMNDKLSGQAPNFRIRLSSERVKAYKTYCSETGCTLQDLVNYTSHLYFKKYFGATILAALTVQAKEGRSHPNQIGMLSDILPFRFELNLNRDHEENLKDLRRELRKVYRHSSVSIGQINRCLSIHQSGRRQAYDILINHMITPESLLFHGLESVTSMTPLSPHKHPMSINLWRDFHDHNVDLIVSANPEIFNQDDLDLMKVRFFCLLDDICGLNPLQKESEEKRINKLSSGKRITLTKRDLIHERIFEVIEQDPERIAIYDTKGKSYSYQWLRSAAQVIMSKIQNSSEPGDVIGIAMGHTPWMIASLLACLKMNRTVLTLDLFSPESCIDERLRRAQSKMILAEQDSCPKFLLNRAHLLSDKDFLNHSTGFLATLHQTPCELDDSAYLIFSSGTTGKPKAINATHRMLANLNKHQLESIQLRLPRKTLLFASMSFDVGLQTVLCTLSSGGTLDLISQSMRTNPPKLMEYIITHKIQRLYVTPSVLQSISLIRTHGKQKSLKEVIVAGEQMLMSPSVRRLLSSSQASLINQYGPAETHVTSEYTLKYPYPIEDGSPVPIGRPLPNVRFTIVNDAGQSAYLKQAGVLYIAGESLAKGYLGQKELTEKKFSSLKIKDISVLHYNTQDRVMLTPSGDFYFLSRENDSVKIRGQFVNARSVSKTISELQGVDRAEVMIDQSNNRTRLIAFVASQSDIVNPDHIRREMLKIVPRSHVPDTIIVLRDFPTTSHGKVDTRTLLDDYRRSIQHKPSTSINLVDTESIITDIIRRNFDLHITDRHSDLRNQGIDSLSVAILLQSIDEAFQVPLNLEIFNQHLSISKLTEYIEAHKSDKTLSKARLNKITKRDEPYAPATSTQRQFYRKCLQGACYNIFQSFTVEGSIDLNKLEESFRILIKRHRILHSNFVEKDEGIWMTLHEGQRQEFTLKSLQASSQDEVEKICHMERKHRFDLSKDCLIRVHWLKFKKQSILLLNIHHCISDGVSLGYLVNELQEIYEGLWDRSPAGIDFYDYAWWEQETYVSEPGEAIQKYWGSKLNRVPGSLRFKHLQNKSLKPGITSFRSFYLNESDIQDLSKNTKISQTTGLLEPLLYAYHLTLKEYLTQDDLLLSTTVTGRFLEGTRKVQGPFCRSLPLAIKGQDSQKLKQSIKSEITDLHKTPASSIYDIKEYISNRDSLAPFSAFNMSNDFQDLSQFQIGHAKFSHRKDKLSGDKREAPINVACIRRGETVSVHIRYLKELFSDAMADQFVKDFEENIKNMTV